MGIDIEELIGEIVNVVKAARVGVPIVDLREGHASKPDRVQIESVHVVVLIDRVDAPTIANISAEIEQLILEFAPMHTPHIHIIGKS